MHYRYYGNLKYFMEVQLYFQIPVYKACNIDRRATRATRDSALWACGAGRRQPALHGMAGVCTIYLINLV